MEKINCSIGILTFNSGHRLEVCLLSVKDFAEIIIADGGSTDNTLGIARRYGCKIISQSNSGKPITDFALERQRILDVASLDWFFYIDSDEQVSDGLLQEIREITKKIDPDFLVYKVPYNLTSPDFSRIYRPFKPYYQTRLFNKKSGAFFIKKVHERISFDDKIKIGELKNPWYVPLDDQLDFKVYKKKVDFRLALLAQNWKSKNPFKFVFNAILPQLVNLFKQLYKMILLRIKFNPDEIVPLKYEFFRLYSPVAMIRELLRRYLSIFIK